MFGGLSVKESSAPAPAPASAPKPDEETSAGSGFSFMGGDDDTENEQGGGEKGNDDQGTNRGSLSSIVANVSTSPIREHIEVSAFAALLPPSYLPRRRAQQFVQSHERCGSAVQRPAVSTRSSQNPTTPKHRSTISNLKFTTASSSPPSSGFSFMGCDTETLEPSPDNTSFSFLTSPPTSTSAKNPSPEPSDLLSAMTEGAPPAGAGVVFGSAVAGGKKIKKVRRSKKVGESLSAT